MNRTLAPSGTPIHFRDLASCIARLGRAPGEDLARQIKSELGVESVSLFATGRGAQTFLLHCMKKENSDKDRRYVVVPSYTCYSVVASVLKSGLEVLVCDIDASTLSLSIEQLTSIDFSKVLAVINTSLYGLPGNMTQVEKIAADGGAYLIDDAAQSFGASYAERPSGTFGDAGILSFDKGKVVTSINGGAIVSNNAMLARRIDLEYERIAKPAMKERLFDLAKLSAFFVMLRPSMYWIPSSMPFLKLGETRYDESYPVTRYFNALAPLVSAQVDRLKDLNEHRRSCASTYSSNIPSSAPFVRIQPGDQCNPIYLRFPLRITDAQIRSRFLRDHRALGCSISYPQAISDVPEISRRISIQNDVSDGGRKVAAELVTLPTHTYVNASDVDNICHGLRSLANEVANTGE